ncbi:MAG: caspase family protein [Gammaproteobacteria bacterium]
MLRTFLLIETRVLTAFLICGVAGPVVAQAPENTTMEGFSPILQYEIVDCLMPGQVRSVGGRVYMTPRRPTRTTTSDCQLRGGEFTLYDRSDLRSSLNVWLPQANGGDPEAQTYVGMLYERGIDGEPDYAEAASWYRKAAKKKHSEAQYNLGTLYERGLGVEQDLAEAFNWYRKAQGVSARNLVYQSTLDDALTAQRDELNAQLRQREAEIEALLAQVKSMQSDASASTTQTRTLQSIIERMQEEQKTAQTKFDKLPQARKAKAAPAPLTPAQRRRFDDDDFGRFYALVIGVEDYAPMPNLTTALNDADRAERVLRDRYGFSVIRLDNPSQLLVMETINRYYDELKADDNLLIYFAGHGEILQGGNHQFGYWLPTDADAAPNDTRWIANELITGHLSRIPARRILVISDSTYAGVLESRPGLHTYSNELSAAYLKIALPKRARLLLASGSKQPVPGIDPTHSRFSKAFFDELESNGGIIHVPLLFKRVVERMRGAEGNDAAQPLFRTIKPARHQLGDFFFVPVLNP